MVQDSIIRVRNLIVTFKVENRLFDAVRNVNLDVTKGEIMSLVGESGSGKTTLCRTIIGLTKASSGTVEVTGKILHSRTSDLRELWRDVQMVFQDPYTTFNPLVPVLDAIETPLRRFGHGNDPIPDRVKTTLDRVGLDYDRVKGKRPSQLSGGERQRAAIARALITNPKVLIADEPISMLDVSLKAGILNLLKDLNRDQGLTILFVTHDLTIASYLSDRLAVMHNGEIVEVGSTSDVMNSSRSAYTQLLLKSIPRLGSSEWLEA
jgi:peptide/nickel transport system ATP-binding protein